MSYWWLFSGEHWMRVFTGQEKSPCATPCRTFHTKTKFLSRVKNKENDDSFRMQLFFLPEMTVTITDFVKPTISSMLSEVFFHPIKINSLKVGGSMGLWLGLGVVQAIQLFSRYLLPLLCRINQQRSVKVAQWDAPLLKWNIFPASQELANCRQRLGKQI